MHPILGKRKNTSGLDGRFAGLRLEFNCLGIFGFTGGAIDCQNCLPCFAEEISAINGSAANNISELMKVSGSLHLQAADCNRCQFCKTEILSGCSHVDCSSLQNIEPMVAQLEHNLRYFTSGTVNTQKSVSLFDYIDVDDRCWRRNMLVTALAIF